tara:strand:- start:87 stop:725 length:639 start_codon:yes stop_codon:yes gene_type:complete
VQNTDIRNHKRIFSNIYDKDIWSNGSGPGSAPEYNKQYIKFLEKFIKENNIKNVLDLGCGDWQFSRHIDWSPLNFYIGIDVVENIIEENISKYVASPPPIVTFFTRDFSNIENIKPFFGLKNQLILLKDVLMHWTNEEIDNWMKEFVKQSFSYALITNGWKYYRKPEKNKEKRDINNRYSWAPLDSQKEPLIKYNPKVVFKYYSKQVSLIKK